MKCPCEVLKIVSEVKVHLQEQYKHDASIMRLQGATISASHMWCEPHRVIGLKLTLTLCKLQQHHRPSYSYHDCITFILNLYQTFNPFQCKGNHIAMAHNLWSWYTGCWWMDCYIWYREEGTKRGCSHAQSPPRCTKCNSPPITGQCSAVLICSWTG